MKKQRIYPGAIIEAEPADFSYNPWERKRTCGCGKPAVRAVAPNNRSLCEGCFFRYTVMEAAGRADEFWAKFTEEYGSDPAGWVHYNIKYTASTPSPTMRIRHIKADDARN